MFGSLQAGRETERTYLTPSSLSLHLALFFIGDLTCNEEIKAGWLFP